MFRELYNYLTENNIEAYPIGKHQCICEKPFVVIRDTGTREAIQHYKDHNIELILFVPADRYGLLIDYEEEISNLMKGYNKMNREYIASPHILDDEKKAYTTTLFYTQPKYYN